MNRVRIIEEVLRLWGLQFAKIREDIPIAGSPDRCLFRVVIEDRTKNLFILENLNAEFISHKKKVAEALVYLAAKGLTGVRCYLPLDGDEYIGRWHNKFWQISPFVEGDPLERPAYAFEGWRGPVLADFLVDLWEKSEEVPSFSPLNPFSIVTFISDFLDKIETHESGLALRVRPAVDFLNIRFLKDHDDLPVRFCHGDYHPLNVIWSQEGINAVIDWEFLGYKPEIYDIAMMIGCLGMEKPQSLTGDLVHEFIKRLNQTELIAQKSWDCLFEFVLALRFAWLSDWLKRSDLEMIDLEAVYIQLLLDNREIFTRSWGI